MPDTLDSSIILQGTQMDLDAGPKAAKAVDDQLLDSQKIAENKNKLKDQAQAQSDSAKINQVTKSLPPDATTAQVVKALRDAGTSEGAILSYQQTKLGVEEKTLDNQSKTLKQKDDYFKLTDEQRTQMIKMTDNATSDLDHLLDGLPEKPSTDQIVLKTTQAYAMLDEELKNGVITPQVAQQIKQHYFTKDPQTGKLTLDIGKVKDAYDHMASTKVAVVQAQKDSDEHKKTLAEIANQEAQANEHNTQAQTAGRHLVQSVEEHVDENGQTVKTPVWSVIDDKGNVIKTGAVAPPKGASANGGGGRDAVYTSRIISAGEEALGDAKNAMEIPLDSNSGWLTGKKSNEGGIMASISSGLANKFTSQDAQNYNVISAGLQRNLGAIEAAGLAPAGSLTHQMDAVIIQPGDTNETAMRKLAQTRQIMENGLKNVLNKPTVNDDQKKEVRGIISNIQSTIPFTQHDITEWKNNGKSGESFADYSKRIKNGDKDKSSSNTTSSPWDQVIVGN